MANKFAIYTAVVGHYDEIKQPLVVDDRFDYILFSNDIKEKRIGIWQIRPIPYFNPIQTKIARWVKTHPEELLDEYEASLWEDSNIVICKGVVYDQFVRHYEEGTLVATMKHHQRDCAYEEMFMLLACRAERERIVLRWGKFLRKNKYPRKNGLCETGVFYRRHHVQEVARFDAIWWNCIEKYSRRDQFSINYSLWKLSLTYEFFLSEDQTVYNSECFNYVGHQEEVSKSKMLKFRAGEGWLIRYYSRHLSEKERIENIYYLLYAMPLPMFWAFLFGHYFRIVDILRNKVWCK